MLSQIKQYKGHAIKYEDHSINKEQLKKINQIFFSEFEK